VISEGARAVGSDYATLSQEEIGYENRRLGGVANVLMNQLKEAGCEHSIRTTVLGHLQRGGVPIAYDRVLATQFGVKAFDLPAVAPLSKWGDWPGSTPNRAQPTPKRSTG